MYILSIIVWASLANQPIIDKTYVHITFESCEAERQTANNTYEKKMINHEIEGYSTSCKKKVVD